MPRQRPLATYPLQQYLALFAKVATTREAVLIPCTPPQAASLRGELYAFRRAAEHAPGEAEALGINLQHLREVAFRLPKEGTGLEALHQSALVGPKLIEAALGGTAPVETPAQASLRRLREMGLTAPAAGGED
jgi:hypothetical protein